MCSALEELKREGFLEGYKKGFSKRTIKAYKDLGVPKEQAAEIIRQECGLSAEEVEAYLKEYW